MKKNYLAISIIFLISCVGKNDRQQNQYLQTLIIKTIEQENIDHEENQLYFFIADYMCVECIKKEYNNIEKDSITVSIIGAFTNKRNFMASTNMPMLKNRVFIDRNKLDFGKIPIQPFYFIYNKKTKNSF